MKGIVWDNIATTIFKKWAYFSLVQDEIVLFIVSFLKIKKITNELENKTEMANEIIKFLNGKTKQELKELNVTDRKKKFMDVIRVLTKKRILHNVENKSH
jgi:hypothetical protein